MESPEENVLKTSSTLPTSAYSTDPNETTTTTTVNNMQEDVRAGKSTYLQVYSIF